ncbi:MAG: hypothetical protein HY751_07040 [Nitrospinae bacterium]|nr:hypothetical protein [Nitrospinota bacterium]
MRRILALAALTVFSIIAITCGGGSSTSGSSAGNELAESCSSTATSRAYLMAFHVCDTSTAVCSNPANHSIRLAGSDDGLNWTLLQDFAPLAGSVPDIVEYDGALYIYHTGLEHYASVNACLQVTESGSVAISGESGGFVDTSLILVDGALTMFYLPGIIGMDPAGCQDYPCVKEIHSARSVNGSASSFAQIPGSRASANLTGGVFSDPDIVSRSNGSYLLYVSSGQSVLGYSSTDIDGSFTGGVTISNGAGGVPSAIEAPDGAIWLYVTTTVGGVEVIRRALLADDLTPASWVDFVTVMNGSALGLGASVSVSSPSIIPWPSSWK